MKFKKRDEHISRDRTQSNDISVAWQDLFLPINNSKGWGVEKVVRE